MQQHKLILLVVDDSVLVLDRLTAMLNEIGVAEKIFTAKSFQEGVTHLGQITPDVALLDINLPDKSGIELLKYIKHNMPGIKVMMITNQSDDYYQNLCRDEGADFFFDKTNDFDKIGETIISIS